ncbi:MAG: uroporphyrinogen-III C-methyltransferase, partial [Gammaproteobacteria bacterium]|nr:uroporphyrinogen-III C-methyltransferase [Gammaproteobacteria bacterium]
VESLAAADSKQQQSLNLKLKETLEAVDRRLGVTSEDWIMAEAEYLLRLANQRVRLDDDVPGARKLLQSADQMLRQAEIVTAFEVRQAIASDLLSLDNIQLVDRQGIYARLTAVLGMINGLKERRPDFEPDQPVAQTGASQPDGWRQTLKHMGNRVLGSLARLVDFRRNETPVRPILPPEEDYYLRHNLLLKLELARMALLNSDQQAYDQSLKEAASWVRQYYDDSDNTTMVFLESVKALAELSVVTEKMDMDASIQAIRHYMQRFRSAPPSIDAGRHLQEDERREETTEESAADSPADNGAEQ